MISLLTINQNAYVDFFGAIIDDVTTTMQDLIP
jgi:hypothetical protein